MGHVGVAARSPGWGGRRVLVTGAAGLLGGWLSEELLAHGATVLGLDRAWEDRRLGAREGYHVIEADVRDQDELSGLLRAERVDTVFHLAAQTLVGPALADPVETFRHNIEGTWSLLEACRRHGSVGAMVVASSDKAYGDAGGRPYREGMALRAHAPYDTSKAAADLLAQSYARTYDMPVTISRCANLYGGGDRNWSRIVPGTIRSIILGERPVIRSDGSPVRDYLHATDAAAGLIRLGEAVRARRELRGEPFNFSAGQRLSVLDLVGRILGLMGSKLRPIIRDEARHEIPAQTVSAGRARRELGWRPSVSLQAGLLSTIDWYRSLLGANGR